MTMRLSVATAPAVEPVSTAEAKAHCRVDVSDDDALIAALIVAARETVERESWHALISRTYDGYLDGWPEGDTIVLAPPPVSAVTSVKYFDADGVEATLASTSYVTDLVSRPARVVLKSSAVWPGVTLREVNGVVVRFVAGFGSAGSSADQSLRQAVLLLVGHWYESREAVVVSGAMPKELPFAVAALCRSYRYSAGVGG